MTTHFVLSVDVGSQIDATALTLIRRHDDGRHELIGASKYPLGRSYADQAARISATARDLIAGVPDAQVVVAVDTTGVGRAMVDQLAPLLLTAPQVRLVECSIQGTKVSGSPHAPKMTVAKEELLLVAIRVLGEDRLFVGSKVDPGLRTELASLVDKGTTSNGRQRFGAPGSNQHDDLALSFLLGLLLSEKLRATGQSQLLRPSSTMRVRSPLSPDGAPTPGRKLPKSYVWNPARTTPAQNMALRDRLRQGDGWAP